MGEEYLVKFKYRCQGRTVTIKYKCTSHSLEYRSLCLSCCVMTKLKSSMTITLYLFMVFEPNADTGMFLNNYINMPSDRLRFKILSFHQSFIHITKLISELLQENSHLQIAQKGHEKQELLDYSAVPSAFLADGGWGGLRAKKGSVEHYTQVVILQTFHFLYDFKCSQNKSRGKIFLLYFHLNGTFQD